MFYVLQNESTANLRRIPILLTDAATGTTAMVGVSTASIYPYVAINGGAFIGGTGPVFESGFGQYVYQMHPAETATLGLAGIHITAPGCRDYDAIAQIAAFNVYSAGGAGLTAGAVADAVWNADTTSYSTNGTYGLNILRADAANKVGDVTLYSSGGVNGVDADVHRIANDTAAATAWKNILTGIGASITSNITGNITGDLSGSVGSVTADVNVSTASMAGIAGTVWSTDISAYTSPSAGYDLVNAAAGGGVTAYAVAQEVWNTDVSAFTTPSAGYDLTQASSAVGATAGDIWSYVLPINSLSAEVTLNAAYIAADAASTQTTSGALVQAIWETNIDYTFGSGYSGDKLIIAANGATTNTASTFWSTDISAYVSPSAGYDLTQASSASGATAFAVAQAVWDYDPALYNIATSGEYLAQTRTEAYAASNNTFELANKVWGNDLASGAFSPYGAGTAGSILYELSLGGGGITAGGVADAVWNSLTSSYTTSGTFGLNTLRSDVAGVAGTVSLWTGGAFSGIFADAYRIDESYVAATALKDILTGIGSSITGNITGNLSGSVGFIVDDVTLSAGTQASIANSVWSYGSRTITGGIADTVTTLTNRSGFAITGGTITTVSDKTGYSLSSTQSFNVTGNITGNVSGSVGSVSGAVGSVAGNVAGNVVGSVASVTNPVSIATASMTGIAGTVWSYGTRTLTSGSGISASDVWNYDISGITTSGSAGNALNDAAVSGSVVTIVNGPYKLNSTAEGTDGRIDILQGSIQTINLNLVNGFGQPFNVTGYSLSVDIYDVSSTLVESYVPTINFASGGNISFDIDGTVTDVIGTYSLVVSLTDGDVIQVGPLQILVRPL